MRTHRLLLLMLLLACTHQAGASPAGDDLDRLLQERGLMETVRTAPASASPGAASASADRMSELVVAAMGAIGVPYRRGGNTYNSGFDCSGFVRAVYDQTLGLMLPRQAAQQAATTHQIERSDLQPGDLVFFNTLRRAFSHVGIYVGDHKFIHSPKPGAAVRIEDMRVNYWNRRFDGARRVAGEMPARPISQATSNPRSVFLDN